MSLLWSIIALIAAALAGARVARLRTLAQCRRANVSSADDRRNVAESVPQVLWQGMPDGRVTFMNLRWTEVTGATVDEGLEEDGWAWMNWFHPEDRQGLLDDWADARAGGEQFSSYRRLLHADGTYRWLQITARPVRNADGTILRWYGVSADIHAEMQAQFGVQALNQTLEQRVEERTHDLTSSERRFRSIFERSHVALFEQDLDALVLSLQPLYREFGSQLAGHLRANPERLAGVLRLLKTKEVNGAALLFLGKERETVLENSRPEFVDAKPFAELLQVIAESRDDHWEGVVTLRVSDGSVKKALCGVTLVRSSEGTRAFTHLSDITDREHTRELLIEAREELSRANRALTVGALSMSLVHDLGQPISSIAIDATVGQRALNKGMADTETASRAVGRVISSARRATEFLNRAREQAVRRERSVEVVDLVDIVRISIGLLEHEIRAQGGSVALELGAESALVGADTVEVQQVLINLILNAMAASQGSSNNDQTILVSLLSGAKAEVVIEIEDGGVGLPAGEEHRIFEPLFSARPDGMGMGLTICRTIIEAFGGSLTARNNARGGATFTFSLPRL